MSFTIREAIGSDYLKVNDLVKEVHQLHVSHRPDVFLAVDCPLEEVYFHELIECNETTLFVVEDTNHELIAYSIVKLITSHSLSILIPSKIAFIDDFCVKSSHQKQGIGRGLFEHVQNHAKAEGATTLQLAVWEFNQDAITFYEALGMITRNRRMELNLSDYVN